MKQYLFAAFLLLSQLINSNVHAELPRSFSATYALYYDDLRIGIMQRTLTRNSDNTGVFESNGKLTGLFALIRKDKVNESSRFEIKDGKIRPLEYQYVHEGSKKSKTEKHIFDWTNNKLISETKEGKKEGELSSGLMDKLLYQLAMMEIKNPSQGLEYDLIDGNTLKTYQFKFEGEEELKTPLGKFKALKFYRTNFSNVDNNENVKKENQRSTILWCAPALHYLPIRVDNVDKRGHLTSIIIKKVKGLK